MRINIFLSLLAKILMINYVVLMTEKGYLLQEQCE